MPDYNTSDYLTNTAKYAAMGSAFGPWGTAAGALYGLGSTYLGDTGPQAPITAPANKLVAFNNLTATSIAFSTVSELIGGGVRIITNADATKYIALPILGTETQTPTIS